tara:strand:+ start:95 stop:352 length:258 start_codon:yes stop_codon:yes gene_type:complete
MPKYVYKCEHCEEHFEIYHGMTETQEKCIYCSTIDPHRVPQIPFIKRQASSKGTKVGEETKAAIEANRTLLKDIKKEAQGNYYDD